jgi:hypothetical protein
VHFLSLLKLIFIANYFYFRSQVKIIRIRLQSVVPLGKAALKRGHKSGSSENASRLDIFPVYFMTLLCISVNNWTGEYELKRGWEKMVAA